jgi:sortilin-related receptor
VRELTFNTTSSVHIRYTSSNRTMSHIFSGIPRGAQYFITIALDVPNAAKAEITASAEPLPAPTQVKVWPEKNGTYVVYWKEISDFTDVK